MLRQAAQSFADEVVGGAYPTAQYSYR